MLTHGCWTTTAEMLTQLEEHLSVDQVLCLHQHESSQSQEELYMYDSVSTFLRG